MHRRSHRTRAGAALGAFVVLACLLATRSPLGAGATSSPSPSPSASGTSSPSPTASSGAAPATSTASPATTSGNAQSANTSAATPSPSPAASSAAGPTVTSDPSSNLSDGQYVKLVLTGFAPNIGLALRQCIAAPKAVDTDCTGVSTVTAVTDDQGAGSAYFAVGSGNLDNANHSGSIYCNNANPCVIAAMTDQNNLATATLAPVTFGHAKEDCPPPGANSILGGGSASAYRAVYAWESAVCQAPDSLPVSYTLRSSGDGINNFLGGLSDFAVTGPFLKPPQNTTSITFKYAPLTTSGVVLAYLVYDLSGVQVTDLTLTPDLIAQIFLGQVPNWNAVPGIKALNPGHAFPGNIRPYVRAEHSAQSVVFTSWLAATAPTTWTPAVLKNKYTSSVSDIFPIAPVGVYGVTGSAGLAYNVATLGDTVDYGNIGFMDSSTAAFYGLPTASIRTASGAVVSATPTTIRQAIDDATPAADGTLALNYADTNPKAWPMPMPTYLVAPTNTIAPALGGTLAGFLRFAVQKGQTILPPGYAPLNATLVSESLQVAGAIPVPPPPTPAPTPAPPPAAPSGSVSGSLSLPSAPPSLTPGKPVAAVVLPSLHPGATASPASPTLPRTPGSGPPVGIRLGRPGDWPYADLLLPAVAGLALAAIVGGAVAEVMGRRRRPGDPGDGT